jgi:hypothetical protein
MNVATPLDLLLKYDRPVPRYTSYPTATAFDSAVGPEHLRELLGAAADSPLSLYVHVPFCRHACWYCGCHRVTTQAGSKAVGPYLEALGLELGQSPPPPRAAGGGDWPRSTGGEAPPTISTTTKPGSCGSGSPATSSWRTIWRPRSR